MLAVTSVHKLVTGAYIKLSIGCKILHTNAFADESIVQHVGCAYRLGVEENVPSEFSDLLCQILFRRIYSRGPIVLVAVSQNVQASSL